MKQVLTEWSESKNMNRMLTQMAKEANLEAYVPKVAKYLQAQVEACLASIEDISDNEDADYYLSVQYVELKARWIQMNLRLSYQAVTQGKSDQEILLMAAATSALLGVLEPSISKTYVDQIHQLLAQPVFGDTQKHAS